eukprot:1157619-Pelagomonas_calceolata.AAC.8
MRNVTVGTKNEAVRQCLLALCCAGRNSGGAAAQQGQCQRAAGEVLHMKAAAFRARSLACRNSRTCSVWGRALDALDCAEWVGAHEVCKGRKGCAMAHGVFTL